ncbi:MAG: glycosyltransferase [Acidimicrobiales bacterium]|nr:glycosyltransferase [Acidimicrobiales bacterium]
MENATDDRAAEPRPVALSVVLCTYQGDRWLGPMLDSLASQTRLPDELVVQDDGSTDGTIRRVRAFASTAPFPVSVAVNDTRLGPTRNFERGLGRSVGRLVALADQDDVWGADKLRRMGELLDEDPTISLLFSDANLVSANGEHPMGAPTARSLWQARHQARHLRAHPVVGATALGRRPISTGCTMVVRRRALDVALPFPDALDAADQPMGHDRWLALIAATVGTVVALDERHVAFRVHEEQATGLDRPTTRARRLAEVAVSAVVGAREPFDRAHLAQARQLEAAADRGYRFGDHEAADELSALAQHHRARVIGDLPRRDRLRSILAEARTGRYGRNLAGGAALAADLARATGRASESAARP